MLAAILSFLIGLSLGLLGGGGSILTLPILVYVLDVEPRTAIAMSLLVVGITSTSGALLHARGGRVRYRTGLVFGATAMAGAYAGGQVAHLLPATVLLTAFAAVMLVTSAAMMRGRRAPRLPSVPAEPEVAKVLAIGAVVGTVAGLSTAPRKSLAGQSRDQAALANGSASMGALFASTLSKEERFHANGWASSFHSAMKSTMLRSRSWRLSKSATRRRLRWMIENHCSTWFIHEQ